MCTVASSSMQTGCVEGRTKTLLMLLCSKRPLNAAVNSWRGAVSAGRGVLDVHMHRARRRRARSTSSQDQACEQCCRHTLDSCAPSTTQCKCTSMRQLPAAAVTRVLDASSMNAASVYSCSAYEIHVRLARSTASQDMSIVFRLTTHLHVATTQCKCRSTRQLPAAYCGRCYMRRCI